MCFPNIGLVSFFYVTHQPDNMIAGEGGGWGKLGSLRNPPTKLIWWQLNFTEA